MLESENNFELLLLYILIVHLLFGCLAYRRLPSALPPALRFLGHSIQIKSHKPRQAASSQVQKSKTIFALNWNQTIKSQTAFYNGVRQIFQILKWLINKAAGMYPERSEVPVDGELSILISISIQLSCFRTCACIPELYSDLRIAAATPTLYILVLLSLILRVKT